MNKTKLLGSFEFHNLRELNWALTALVVPLAGDLPVYIHAIEPKNEAPVTHANIVETTLDNGERIVDVLLTGVSK